MGYSDVSVLVYEYLLCMKVLLVCSYSKSLLIFRFDFVQSLLSAGYCVALVAPLDDNFHIVRSRFSAIGVEVFPFNLSRFGLNPFSSLLSLFQLFKIILRVNPSIVIPYTFKPITFLGLLSPIASFFGRSYELFPLVTGLGYFFGNVHLTRLHLLVKYFLSATLRFSFLRSVVVIYQNADDYADLLSLNVHPRSINHSIVSGSGVSLSRFPPYKMPDSDSFLCVARLVNEKGIRELLGAASLVKSVYPRVQIVLAGMPELDSFSSCLLDVQRAHEAGLINYVGHCDDISKLLSHCTCFVLPSYREGLPRSSLEALASARPIISTDVPGCRETVVDGLNGYLVPARNHTKLAESMIKFLSLSRSQKKSMSEMSLDFARTRFDVRIVNSQILKLLSS